MSSIPKLNMTSAYIVAGGIVIVVLAFFAKKVGLISPKAIREAKKEVQQTKAERKVIDSRVSESDAFDPNYYKSVFASMLAPTDVIIQNTKVLRKAMRGLGTNESQIYGVFRSVSNAGQVSQMAYAYNNMYKRSLVDDLIKELTNKEIQEVYRIINSY